MSTICKVYANSSGAVLGYRQSAQEERRVPIPASAVRFVTFDAATNTALLADLAAGLTPYTITAASELRKSGQPVSINAPGAAAADWLLIAQLNGDIADLASPLTLTQLQPIVRRGLRILRHVLREQREAVD